jgi:hypothetical protein
MGSAWVRRPPQPHLIALYYFTTAEHAINNVALSRLKVARFSEANDPFELMWPAPGLDDTQLSKSSLPLELHGAQITDRRVSAFRVVEALNIVKHIWLCFIARPVRFVAGALGLQ